jgi:hypothetical protein
MIDKFSLFGLTQVDNFPSSGRSHPAVVWQVVAGWKGCHSIFNQFGAKLFLIVHDKAQKSYIPN